MTVLWTLALAAGVLWPGRVLSVLDGIPLDGRLEAVLVGVVLPALWWMDRKFLSRIAPRIAIAALLALKMLAHIALPQHGLCGRFSTDAPFSGVSSTIPIDEPTGLLRSWDLRADWRAIRPRCTAILDRPYRSSTEFPVWFLNILDTIRPGRNDLALEIGGHVTVQDAGNLEFQFGRDTRASGHVDDVPVSSNDGEPIVLRIPKGTHAVDLELELKGDQWRFVPLWNGRDAWSATEMTVSAPSRFDLWASWPIGLMTSSLVFLLVAAWSVSLMRSLRPSFAMSAWTLLMATLVVLIGVQGRFDRITGPLLLGSVLVPIGTRHRNWRTVAVMVGIPWMALFLTRSLPQIGQVSAYSANDDWSIFQSAAYRIFLQGYWLEGGSRTFYFQPLYRWVAGALHVIFGDSSVGETYWDAACLLGEALLSYALVKRVAGFRWGMAAAAATLATFTIGTVWYLIGRGLSEITAAGWMTLGIAHLWRARSGRIAASLGAAIFAVLMFYTRLNHLLFAGALIAFLLPTRTAAQWSGPWRAIRMVNARTVAIYLATIAAGVGLFAARTWWYTGHFSVLYGTSFAVQQTGLGLNTIDSSSAWARVGGNLSAMIWMNEPPRPDVRAALVALGVVLSLAALVQIPYANRLPLSIALATGGAMASSFIAFAHHYPGRMSVHLVPFAVAMTACAASRSSDFVRHDRSTHRSP